MGISVILAGAAVAILIDRLVRRQFLQPVVVILVQAAFVVVDEHAGCDMHGVDQGQNLLSHIPLSPLYQPMPL
jgi:hypothetical protein